ncbi:GNAT family N-acetyltransferase [Pullulanibacillus sp. KACC 23026]|uniref:GNAT family N-acetyltransferase n=1 Tax=Pullulanibacillus sp. KACC 23026 TaxID=3028315 RepID=UPI0023AE7297|nr:GNAT family N-acetyltransferase [Pullulanibacillus sp. KACC 23026]WEG13235.1 GNAT family N-acetyltransferase [Pullulanibacillus sp. KACC 23026]
MIRLDEMNASEFNTYLNYAIRNYADEHVKAGNWNAHESMSKAAKEFEQLLPEGEKTAKHKFFVIRVGDQEVGMIWLAERSNQKGFIYDINIWEGYQGLGYGKQAMKEIEEVARKLGLESIGLHVFGHNQIARRLYDKLGYIETDILMEKKI